MPDLYYIEPEDFTKYYDERRVQELLSDTGEEVATGDIAANPLLLDLIVAATGEINTVVLQGRRYTVQNLQDLLAADDTTPMLFAAKKTLNQLCADLVFGMLLARRGYAADVMERLAPRYKSALATLEALYQGKRVFYVEDAIDSGVPHPVRIGGNAYSPSRDNKLFGVFWDSPLGGYFDPRSRNY